MVLVEDVEAVDEELIGGPRAAVVAGVGCSGVAEVSTSEGDEVFHVRLAGLS